MYQAGRLVALEHYDADGPLWTTAGITFLYPPAGLITGIIIAVIPPNLDEQFYPDMSLLSDPNFAAGYKKQAHKRKVGKTATGLGIGFAAAVVLNLLIGN